MRQFELKSQRFRSEREEDWRRLDRLLERVESQGAKSLSDSDLLALPVLYRAALSSLSVARSTALDQDLISYLESLSTRAYFIVYGTRARLSERIGSFFARGWPLAAQALWKETVFGLVLTLLGAVAAYLLVTHDADWLYAVFPPDIAQGRDPTASTEALRRTLYDDHNGEGLAGFATMLFTHNSGVAILAFALGFAFGAPTAILVTYNGLMLGGMLGLFAPRGLAFELGGWLSIHGVTEIFACTLAGAAGFHIGWAMAFPGDRPRTEALAQAGRTAGTLMAGVVLMLLCAGLLEGLGRQLVQNDIARYAIGWGIGLLWVIYFYTPRRSAA
ncbi:MAG: stage II sporulation protein M [Caulobacteraceae bacterium]